MLACTFGDGLLRFQNLFLYNIQRPLVFLKTVCNHFLISAGLQIGNICAELDIADIISYGFYPGGENLRIVLRLLLVDTKESFTVLNRVSGQ